MNNKIKLLYDGDTSVAFVNSQELETLSEKEDILYPHVDEFVSMLKSKKYVIRVRGIRLLCKQAKWDIYDKINESIEDILIMTQNEKPTAIRQTLQYLEYIVPYKKNLNNRIKQTALSIDCSTFKDTMRPLISKDIQSLVRMIDTLEEKDIYYIFKPIMSNTSTRLILKKPKTDSSIRKIWLWIVNL